MFPHIDVEDNVSPIVWNRNSGPWSYWVHFAISRGDLELSYYTYGSTNVDYTRSIAGTKFCDRKIELAKPYGGIGKCYCSIMDFRFFDKEKLGSNEYREIMFNKHNKIRGSELYIDFTESSYYYDWQYWDYAKRDNIKTYDFDIATKPSYRWYSNDDTLTNWHHWDYSGVTETGTMIDVWENPDLTPEWTFEFSIRMIYSNRYMITMSNWMDIFA